MEERELCQPTVDEVLAYRKVAMAVVAIYSDMPRPYVQSILDDQMDEYLEIQEKAREQLRITDFRSYLELMGKECTIRYAATAAEGLAAPADSDMAQFRIMGDTGLLGLTDDMNAIARVEQILEAVVPDGFTEEEGDILGGAMRGLCDFYNAVAYRLVQEDLVDTIVEGTERLLVRRSLTQAELENLLMEKMGWSESLFGI